MNAPLNSDSQLYTAPETGRPVAPSSYAPSVPISVYRELAAELKTTQSTLDALTQQNHEIIRQNQLLRTEIQRFVQSAAQLGHFAGVTSAETYPVAQQEPTPIAPPAEMFLDSIEESLQAPPQSAPQRPPVDRPEPPQMTAPASPPPPPHGGGSQGKGRERQGPTSNRVNSAIVPHPKSKKRDRGRPTPDTKPYRLFTEQPEEGRPLSKVASRSDLGNLWLATTILVVVVSAFGAGFLIMRPLLNR